jgi:hypothetical protein
MITGQAWDTAMLIVAKKNGVILLPVEDEGDGEAIDCSGSDEDYVVP